MARPLRIEYEGAFYHVTSRGNEGRRVYFSKSDYDKFVDYLKRGKEKYQYLLHGYVLMTNHYHLLIETPLPNLNRVMHYLNGSYTNYFNLKRNYRGHLLQGRYKAILVDRDSYLLELSRYFHLNPVRAKIVERPEDYPYSSYRAYIGRGKDDIVDRDVVLGMMAKDSRKAIKLYRDFVSGAIGDKIESPLKKVFGGIILGTEEFIKETLEKLREEDLRQKKGISHAREFKQRYGAREIMDRVAADLNISPDEVCEKRNRKIRGIIIYLIKRYTGFTNGQIGQCLGNLSEFAVAKAYQRFLKKLEKDQALEKEVEKLRKSLSNVKTPNFHIKFITSAF
jgi:putative transposase